MVFGDETVLDASAISRIVRRVASEIIERVGGTDSLCLIGIRRGGVPIAQRLADEIQRVEGTVVPVGTVDITLYRDDAATALPSIMVGPSDVPFNIDAAHAVLVDDVLHTGRTVRAAIDCLHDHGRPRRIWLAVLCDRGGRELPVAPDFVGRSLEVPEDYLLDVIIEGASTDRAVVRRGQAGSPGGDTE